MRASVNYISRVAFAVKETEMKISTPMQFVAKNLKGIASCLYSSVSEEVISDAEKRLS